MQANDFKFQTDVHINNVDCPIMIIHAEDDGVVPFKLGQKVNIIIILLEPLLISVF